MGRDQQRSRRLRGDRGTALIESAIILPFLVLMVFGIVELGFLFRSASVVNTSTRSGARLAAAQYASARKVPASQLNVITAVRQTVEKDLSARAGVDTPVDLWIYKADPNGVPFKAKPSDPDFGTCTDPCFVYKWDPSASPPQFVLQAGGGWPDPVVCGISHDSIGVFVRVQHSPIGFTNFLGTLTINEHSVMVLEPPNPNDCPRAPEMGDGRPQRRGSGDRGVVIVEAVFILPVLIFIVMAIFEFGLLFAAQSTTQSSTRDGVRFGSANYAVSGSNQAAADQIAATVAKDLTAATGFDTPIKLVVYKADDKGEPTGGFTSCNKDCYRYTWDASTSSWTFDTGSPTWPKPSACINVDPKDPSAGLNTLDSIGAYLEVRHDYLTGAFGSSQLIKEHSVSRLEPLPSGQC